MSDFGSWGWKLFKRRGLVLPAGSQVEPAPAGRGALRVNELTKTIQFSFDEGPYQDLSVPPVAAENIVFVFVKDDLPAPVAGVITLDPTKLYFFRAVVDLGTDRIDLNGSSIQGVSPVVSGLRADTAQPLVSSTAGGAIRELSLANPSGAAVDLSATEFIVLSQLLIEDCASVGRIGDAQVVTIFRLGISDVDDGIDFDGTVGTLSVFQTQIVPTVGAGAFVAVDIAASASFGFARFLSNEIVTVQASDVGFDIDPAASFGSLPGEFLLNSFSGPGTGLTGSTTKDPRLHFLGNRNILDSSVIGFLSFVGNTTATVIAAASTPVNIGNGTTSPPHVAYSLAAVSERMTVTGAFPNQQLTYTGLRDVPVQVVVNAVLERVGAAGPFGRIYLLQNGVPIAEATDGIELDNIAAQVSSVAAVTLQTNDTLRLQISNETNNNNIIVRSARISVVRTN